MNHRPSLQSATYSAIIFASASLLPSIASAQISYSVSFNDPGGAYASYYDSIRTDVLAAGQTWADHMVSNTPVDLSIQVNFTNEATASSGSTTTGFVGTSNGYNVFEQGAAYEVRTGNDPNGATVDIGLNIGTSGYLQNELWFDPDPLGGSSSVPADKTDAYSIFLHEFGHDFVFNGFRDNFSGALPGDYESTYDQNIVYTNGNFYFTGSNAEAVYGGPVPLTYGSYTHLGNVDPRPGQDLVTDVMGGSYFQRGTHYSLSNMDLAIAKDVGINIKAVPAPSEMLTLLLGGVPGAVALTRRRKADRSKRL